MPWCCHTKTVEIYYVLYCIWQLSKWWLGLTDVTTCNGAPLEAPLPIFGLMNLRLSSVSLSIRFQYCVLKFVLLVDPLVEIRIVKCVLMMPGRLVIYQLFSPFRQALQQMLWCILVDSSPSVVILQSWSFFPKVTDLLTATECKVV